MELIGMKENMQVHKENAEEKRRAIEEKKKLFEESRRKLKDALKGGEEEEDVAVEGIKKGMKLAKEAWD